MHLMHLGQRKSLTGLSPSPGSRHECRLHPSMTWNGCNRVIWCRSNQLRLPRRSRPVIGMAPQQTRSQTLNDLFPFSLTCRGIKRPSEKREILARLTVRNSDGRKQFDGDLVSICPGLTSSEDSPLGRPPFPRQRRGRRSRVKIDIHVGRREKACYDATSSDGLAIDASQIRVYELARCASAPTQLMLLHQRYAMRSRSSTRCGRRVQTV